MAIVETRVVTGGVDTHADTHVAAALDGIGGLLGTESFPVSAAGYSQLLAWLASHGTVVKVGVEGTGSYGAGLSRHLAAEGVTVVEVCGPNRQERRRTGKSDTLDAVAVAKRSARGQRIATINQARSLVFTGPEDIRARFAAHTTSRLVAELAVLRPRSGEPVGYSTRLALRELARRVQYLEDQADRLDELIVPLVTARAPSPARRLRRRGRHRRGAARRRRRQPRTAPLRGRLGAPLRCRPRPLIVGQRQRPPRAQHRRRPPRQPRPVAHRLHPHDRPSGGGLTPNRLPRSAGPRTTCRPPPTTTYRWRVTQ